MIWISNVKVLKLCCRDGLRTLLPPPPPALAGILTSVEQSGTKRHSLGRPEQGELWAGRGRARDDKIADLPRKSSERLFPWRCVAARLWRL